MQKMKYFLFGSLVFILGACKKTLPELPKPLELVIDVDKDFWVVGSNVSFDASLSKNAAPSSYVWDLGIDNYKDDGPVANYKYHTIGRYKITLKAQSIHGDTGSTSITIEVLDINGVGMFMDQEGNEYNYKVMEDGKPWMTKNLNITNNNSWCYDDLPQNCNSIGRLYNWEAAKEACSSLGEEWHLPTDEEWRTLINAYGGYVNASSGVEIGNASESYNQLIYGGVSNFNANEGGLRTIGGNFVYENLDGYYWSATSIGIDKAYNFSFLQGDRQIHRIADSQDIAISVRCVGE